MPAAIEAALASDAAFVKGAADVETVHADVDAVVNAVDFHMAVMPLLSVVRTVSRTPSPSKSLEESHEYAAFVQYPLAPTEHCAAGSRVEILWNPFAVPAFRYCRVYPTTP